MHWFRWFLAVLAFSVAQPALAVCPNPLPVGQLCCGYTVNVQLRSDPLGPPGTPRATNALLVNSLAECRAIAQIAHDAEAERYGCLPPLVASFVESPLPSPDGVNVSQGFWNLYQEYRPGTIIRQDCLKLTGSIGWTVPPPPPPVACSIPDLPAIPTSDACTTSLEANDGLVDPAVCPMPIPVLTRAGGEPCLRGKLSGIGVAYGGPTSTLRTAAYNQHLINVWDFNQRHRNLRNNPEQWQACTARRAAVRAEVVKHDLYRRPAPNSRHLRGRAFDVALAVVNGVQTTTGDDSSALLVTASPNSPACTMTWGGTWPPGEYDPIHFELNVP